MKGVELKSTLLAAVLLTFAGYANSNEITYGDWKIYGFGGINIHAEKTSDGLVFYGEVVNEELDWGGWNIRSKDNKSPLFKLGEGKWEMCFEINANEPDEFGDYQGGNGMEIKVLSTDEAKGDIAGITEIKTDSDHSTWEKFHIPLTVSGPLDIKSVSFQYWKRNPEKGVRIRQICFQKIQQEDPAGRPETIK